MQQSYKWLSGFIIIIVFASCHSIPESILNNHASLNAADQLPENPLLLVPLTSSINHKDSTMSTLYGNELAASYAKTHTNNLYPKGALLYQVNWKQQPDAVWFGANIPERIVSVERIIFNDNGVPVYELYQGKPLKKSRSQNDQERIAFISSQRMAVSP